MPTPADSPVFAPNALPVADAPPVEEPGVIGLGSAVSYTDLDGGTGEGVVVAVVPDDPSREGGVPGWLVEVLPTGAEESVMVLPTELALVGDEVAEAASAGVEFARGAPIRGEGGRFGGSEPGEPEDGGEGGNGNPSELEDMIAAGDLTFANFEDVDLSGRELANTPMQECRITDSNLQGVDLRNADMLASDFKGSDFDGASMTNVNANGATFEYGNVSNVSAAGSDFRYANFASSRSENSDFSSSDMNDSSFFLAEASGSNFSGSNLQNAEFTGATVEGANFEGADLRGATFTDAKGMDGANFKGSVHDDTTTWSDGFTPPPSTGFSSRAEFGEPIRAEGGKFAGSEPGPGSPVDRAAGLGAPTELSPESAAAVEEFLNGNTFISNDPNPGVGYVNPADFEAAFEPAGADVTVSVPEAIESGRLVAIMGDDMAGTQIQFATEDGSVPLMGCGSGAEALSETGVIQPAEAGLSTTMMQVSVPAGHPVVNLGDRAAAEADPMKPSSGFDSTGVILHPATVYTVTGAGVTADGKAVMSVTASMPEGA